MTQLPTSRTDRARPSGQVLVIFALALFGVLALTAMVLDGGQVYLQRRTAQTAADAGALAGLRMLKSHPAPPASNSNNTIAPEICNYVSANSFAHAMSTLEAFFVGVDGETRVGDIIGGTGVTCAAPTAASIPIPSAASGIRVNAGVTEFPTYLLGLVGVGRYSVSALATAQVGVLTGFDPRSAPLLVCSGGEGNALRLLTITPGLIHTAVGTPGRLAATPASLPMWINPGVKNDDVGPDTILATPVGTPPSTYVPNSAKDGNVYYLKGQRIGDHDSDCDADGFKGAAHTVQPTGIVNTGDLVFGEDTLYGDAGNDVPGIAERVSTSGACPGGTDLDNFTAGAPGCVMILPLLDAGESAGGQKPVHVAAWAAFYVWCLRNSGGTCQEIGGQFLNGWEGVGPASNGWTYGNQSGGIAVLRLTR